MRRGSDLRLQMKKLHQIGIALSKERNLSRLLEMIVDEARGFTGADGGTLYLLEGDHLQFSILQNVTLGTRAVAPHITLPPVPLCWPDGAPNHENVSAYVALTGETVNIKDAYEVDGFNFEGTRRFDAQTGYRTKSMLVTPLRDHEEQVIGVLQLLNAQDPDSGETVPFLPDDVDLLLSLASQAAVAITNMRLIQETEELFESLVRVTAAALDERSPSTAGHIKRVTEITVALAKIAHESPDDRFSHIRFSEDDLNEIRIAALMHDVGKITTPFHIVEKRTKLEQLFDLVEVIKVRFALIQEVIRSQALERKIQLLQAGAPQTDLQALEDETEAAMQQVADDLAFLISCNVSVEWMPPEKRERLQLIASKTFSHQGQTQTYLTALELACLAVPKGNLTDEERAIMEEHAASTIRLLSQIPFTRKLKRVPEYAGGHHERLNGKGYPLGLSADQIPMPTRIMAIADVYEALTAGDRSYKTARSQEEALRILGFMVKDGDLDPDLVDLFIQSGLYKKWGTPKAVLEAAPGAQPTT